MQNTPQIKNHHVWTWIVDPWECDPFFDEYVQDTDMFLAEMDKPKDKCSVEEDGTIFHNLGLENEEILRKEMKGDEI